MPEVGFRRNTLWITKKADANVWIRLLRLKVKSYSSAEKKPCDVYIDIEKLKKRYYKFHIDLTINYKRTKIKPVIHGEFIT